MEWKMIDKTDIEMKEESKNSKNYTGLSIETLKQMGYKHPCTVRWIIEAVEQGKDLKDIKSGFIESRIATKQDGHILFVFVLSGLNLYNNEMEMEIHMMGRKDFVFFIDRVWVPSNDGRLLRKVFEAICDGKTVEESLECLKKEETAQPQRPEKEAPAPESSDKEGEKVQIMTEGRSDVIEVNKDAACDDTAKAKGSDKEEASEPAKRPNDWWTQPINDIEFTRVEFDKAKAKRAEKSEAPCDLQCAVSFRKSIFEEKCALYGLSFCHMNTETVTDQLYMKATILKMRLTDRDKGKRFGLAFFEGFRDEFAAIVNYGVIALLQGGFGVRSLVPEDPIKFYTDQMQAALSLIRDKGDDYGELWRELRIGTFADMIYTKVRRLKGIEDQYRFGSMTKEGYHKFAGDQYRDLINYGLFGVVRMTEIADVMAFEMEEDETDEEEGYE